MIVRMILVPVDGSPSSFSAADAAFRVAARNTGHVTCLHVRSDPKETIPLLGEGMSVAMIEDMMKIADQEGSERSARARACFDETVAKHAITVADEPGSGEATASWRDERGREDELVARLGRLSDLIVAPRPTAESPVSATLSLNSALFDTGRPVLVVPPDPVASIGRKVAVSWNGSPQASRAVGSSLSFLKNADEVTVFTARSPRFPEARSEDLAHYLRCHGIGCSTAELTAGTGSVGAELLEKAGARDVDLVIMGAYTHSRFRQLILGGMTRHVLENSPLPLLMAH